MRRLWRLAKASRAHDSLEEEAEGAKRAGGRWNNKGTPVIYTTHNVSTAAMEVLVHIDWALAPAHVLLAIDVPDDATVERLEESDLPRGWDDFPAPSALAYMGDDWVRGKTALLLDVPSAASPYERCVLINPLHPDIARCTLTVFGPYDFDGRLNPNDS